ncbi:hypothetical protein TL16_g04016 [Triparma laevis f. inornata]|uniref:Uncharacterized protein n=1 Tax=Triparma laevis f. inornata TaxID=1714386 RepID=A0A9W7E6S5_9STRA|nr:hypothetical protein TL16_g04016 [Triparma laevis f. inornata]
MSSSSPEIPLPTMTDLTRLLHEGLCDTLRAAKEAEALTAPFGRPPVMTVEDVEEKINADSSDEDSDEDGENSDDDSDSDASDASIEFTYKYGFNPLTHLGKFLKRTNPKNVLLREQQRNEAREFLKKRSMHSLRQMSVKDEIEGIARRRMTGIVSGPGVTLRGDGTAVIWCKVDRPGRIVVQVGRSEEDQSDDFTAFADVQQGKEGDPCVGIVRVEKLQSDTKYYLKVGLETDDNAFRGIEGGDVIKSSFKTLLDSDERGEVVVNVGSLGTKGFGGRLSTPKGMLKLLRDNMNKVWTEGSELSTAATSLSLFCAFNDATKGSDDLLLNEELALSKSSSKSKSKRRQTQSQGTTPHIKAFSEYFPTELVKKPTRHLYDSVPLSLHAELYLLDTRSGFLGGNQAKWLTSLLESSTCKWKIIASSSSSTYSRQIDQSVVHVPHADEEERKAQTDAASVIQMKAKEKKEKKERTSSKKKKIGGAWIDVEKFLLEKNIPGVVLLTSECRSFGISKAPWGWEVSVGTFVEEQHPDFSTSGAVEMPLEDGGGYVQLKVSEEGALTVKRRGGKSDGLELNIKMDGEEEEKKEGGEENNEEKKE